MILSLLFYLSLNAPAYGAPKAVESLEELQRKSLALQKNLLTTLKSEEKEKIKLRQINELIKTQKKEQQLAQNRLEKLETFIAELLSRKNEVQHRIQNKKEKIQSALKKIYQASIEPSPVEMKMEEKLYSPRVKALGLLADQGFKELEALRVDLQDAQDLEAQIQNEKHQLEYLLADLSERQGLLTFHKKLQADILKKNYQKRVEQLESYRDLKNAQAQVEGLMTQFNARLELENVLETKKKAPEIISTNAFLDSKGALPLPIDGGKVLTQFGRTLDSSSQLYVFKKGIEIQPESSSDMYAKSVFPGKVVYSGELPSFGKVIIIDHGARYFSLLGYLKSAFKKEGEWVGQSEAVGQLEANRPLYFEIRSKNVAVDPVQWLSLASLKN